MRINGSSTLRTSESESQTGGRAWLSIVVLVLFMILSQIDRNSISIMVDPIKTSLGVSDWEIGLLQGPAFAIFFLLGSVVVGWMVDKYSERWIIYLGVTVWSIATIFGGLSTGFLSLMIARGIVGLGESVLQPAAWRIMARLFPARKLATAIGILTAGAQAGVAASFMLVGALMSNTDKLTSSIPLFSGLPSWQMVFLITGIPGVILAFLIFIIPRNASKPVDEKNDDGGLLGFIKNNKAYLIFHFLGFGLLSVLVHGAAAWTPTYLMRMHGIDVKDIGFLVGLIVIPVGVGGAVFAGWLVDRAFKNRKTDAHFSHFAYRSAVITVLGGMAFMLKVPLAFTLICFGCIQFIQPFSGVAGASLQIVTPERYRGRMSGIFIMFYNSAGLMFGPSLVALLSDTLGTDQIGMAIGISYVVLGTMAALLLWAGRKYATSSITSNI